MRAIFLLAMAFLLIGCSYHVKPKEEELKNYPWMEVFMPGRQDFEGIDHDLNLGYYSFSFMSKYDEAEFFRLVDSGAVAVGWSIEKTSIETRTYKRPNTTTPASQGDEIVLLKYEPKSGRIAFERKRSSF